MGRRDRKSLESLLFQSMLHDLKIGVGGNEVTHWKKEKRAFLGRIERILSRSPALSSWLLAQHDRIAAEADAAFCVLGTGRKQGRKLGLV